MRASFIAALIPALAPAVGLLLAGQAQAAPALTQLSTWTVTGQVEGQPLVLGGTIYGVYSSGSFSATHSGFVYALTPPASGTTYTQTTISSFSGGTTGGNPVGGLIADASGNLYGAAATGGSTDSSCSGLSGCGLIYQLVKSGSTWTRNVLYTFTGGSDGSTPVGNLIADSTGALYGVTQQGGGCSTSSFFFSGCGTVFKLTPPASGTSWTYKQLYAFKGTVGTAVDGSWPSGPLARDSSGNLYGVTQFGGMEIAACGNVSNPSNDARCGTIFKLAYNASTGAYTESVLHQFTDGADGSFPAGGLVADTQGNIYGTTLQGGSVGTANASCLDFGYSGCGLVFKLTAANGYAKTSVHVFTGADGAAPSGLVINRRGHLFGVTSNNTAAESCPGGSGYYCGSAFEMQPNAAGYATEVLYKFSGTPSPITGPLFGVGLDTTGHIFGVALNNTTSYAFALSTPGSGVLP